MRMKLEELGVDTEILAEIDKLSSVEKDGLYHLFLEILNDELLFVVSLNDYSILQKYNRKKEYHQPMVIN